MGMSDCSKCWETPCVCGGEYKDWSNEKLVEMRDMFNRLIGENTGNVEVLPADAQELVLDVLFGGDADFMAINARKLVEKYDIDTSDCE